MPPVYIARSSFKNGVIQPAPATADTLDDPRIDAVLNAVSRAIDQYCGRFFFPAVQTRLFTAEESDCLDVPDLTSITSLKTDYDQDLVYETTWSASDYILCPHSAPFSSPPEPYSEIEIPRRAATTRYFPLTDRAIEIVGTWGYYNQTDTASATVNGAIGASVTTLVVTSAAEFEPLQTILIGSEQLQITAISGTTLTVKRGQNGTTAAGISHGATISTYSYPVISEACFIQASRIFKRKESPFGVAGGGEYGPMRIGRLDPDVREFLQPFRLSGFA